MVWSPCSPRDSQESSPGPQIKSINSLLFCLLFGPTLTSISDYWNERMTILVFSVHLGWKTRESWVVLLGKSFVTISSCLSLLQMWKPRPTRLPEAYTGPVGQSQNDIHIYFPNFWSGLFPLKERGRGYSTSSSKFWDASKSSSPWPWAHCDGPESCQLFLDASCRLQGSLGFSLPTLTSPRYSHLF